MNLSEKGQEYTTRFNYAHGHNTNGRLTLALAAGFGLCALTGVGVLSSDADAAMGFYLAVRSMRDFGYARDERVAGEVARDQALREKTSQYGLPPEAGEQPE